MIKLRDYQADFKARINEAFGNFRAVLAVCPTGGGKTVVFSDMIREHVGASAAVVHRKEIIAQISLSLASMGVRHRVVVPSGTARRIRRKHYKKFGQSFVDDAALVGVASVQTLTSNSSDANSALQGWLQQVTFAVYDEGHHYVKKGRWAKAFECMPNAKTLQVTASPKRADGLGLGIDADGFAEVLVEGPTTAWLIDNGYLSPFKYFAPKSDLDVSSLTITATGDYTHQAMRAKVVESHLVGDVVSHYLRFAKGKKCIVFATDVLTAEEMAAAFQAAGIRAAALSGETEEGVRDKTLEDFEGDGYEVLVNVDLFDEGFDVPAVDALIMARPTESLAKYLQMVGRVLRVVYAKGFDLETVEGRKAAIAAGPKPHAIVVDPVRNWERHMLPNFPRKWSLDGNTKGAGVSRSGPSLRSCLECTQPFERFYLSCPYCGAEVEPAGRATVEQVEGDLTELDADALAALAAEVNKALRSDEAYMDDMRRAHVNPVYAASNLKKHKAVRQTRLQLRELLGYWFGHQPEDRPLAERHKRFFLRFGIDAATALTLNAADTEALIKTISERFQEDVC